MMHRSLFPILLSAILILAAVGCLQPDDDDTADDDTGDDDTADDDTADDDTADDDTADDDTADDDTADDDTADDDTGDDDTGDDDTADDDTGDDDTADDDTADDDTGDDDTADDDTADDDTGDDDTALACDAIMTFEDGQSPTAEIHVDPGGSDQNGDGSSGNPYATIGHAAGLATPGIAVVVHQGTYAGGTFLYDVQGTDTAPIWIGGAVGENRPVIDGGNEGLHLIRARYLIVHDLEVRNAADNGINCDDGGEYANPLATHHVVFRDLLVHDIGAGGNQDCIKLSGLNDYWILDSEIHHCGGGGSGSGVDHVGCHHGLIARNYIHDNPANSTPSLPVTETAGIYGQDPAFTTGIEIDGTSPAAGAGVLYLGVTGDIVGQCYADPPSIGAFEASPP